MNWHTSLAVHRPTSRPRAWQGIAAGLVRVAAGRAPGGLSERLEEEWLAIIPELDGALARLRFALGCLWAATMIHAEPLAVSAAVTSGPSADICRNLSGPRSGSRWSPRQSTATDAVICNLNTTPLIDVMLVLIVTLIVSLPSMTHAVKLQMAREAATQNNIPAEIINLDIDFDGTVVWNGSPVSGMPALESYYQAEADKAPLPQINLRPDRRAPYDVVAKVLASAQRNGMDNIVFANTAEFQ
jgi:biopolymer transport protein ExbD